MKNYIAILAIAALVGVSAIAQTNAPAESGKSSGQWEITLGGGGTELRGENIIGADFSVSTNPFKTRPEVWVGVAQGLYWEPSFAGSTDVFVDWSQNIWNDTLYLNVGWSGGALYDNSGTRTIWRTGPEATLQYYTSDTAFIYAGVNYDVFSSDNNEGGFRYSFGIGITF